jgi:uncharacterized membrane protein
MFNSVYEFLAKIGYHHPIHPTEVHMPIGMVVGALGFTLLALIFRWKNLRLTAHHCIIFGCAFILPTILFGFMDWQHFYGGAWLFPIKVKLILAPTLLVLTFIAYLVGRKAGVESKVVILLYSICFCLVVALGYFGGQLVYGNRTPPAVKAYRAGAKIFKGNCSGCHPHGGNAIVPNLPLTSAPQLEAEDSFIAFIRSPKMPDGSRGVMPPFSPGKISPEQARELYEYIYHVVKNPTRQ